MLTPDYQAEEFGRKGEFSIKADYAFEKHLKRLYKLKKEFELKGLGWNDINLWSIGSGRQFYGIGSKDA